MGCSIFTLAMYSNSAALTYNMWNEAYAFCVFD
jgi:hypothetical protein